MQEKKFHVADNNFNANMIRVYLVNDCEPCATRDELLCRRKSGA